MTRVLTTGVFDLFHVGHLRAIQKAKSHGSHLVVAISNDADVSKYKRAPIIPLEQRMEIVGALRCVDEVVECPLVITEEFYRTHRIDVHCQGDEPAGSNFYEDGRRLGIIRFLGRDSTTDTTSIIAELDRRLH
jgi:cytidyltransferase-like protein